MYIFFGSSGDWNFLEILKAISKSKNTNPTIFKLESQEIFIALKYNSK